MKRKMGRERKGKGEDALIVLNKGAGNKKKYWKFQIQKFNACKIFPFFLWAFSLHPSLLCEWISLIERAFKLLKYFSKI